MVVSSYIENHMAIATVVVYAAVIFMLVEMAKSATSKASRTSVMADAAQTSIIMKHNTGKTKSRELIISAFLNPSRDTLWPSLFSVRRKDFSFLIPISTSLLRGKNIAERVMSKRRVHVHTHVVLGDQFSHIFLCNATVNVPRAPARSVVVTASQYEANHPDVR